MVEKQVSKPLVQIKQRNVLILLKCPQGGDIVFIAFIRCDAFHFECFFMFQSCAQNSKGKHQSEKL